MRSLSATEAISAELRTFIIYTVLAEGRMDLGAMRRAFGALREAHPMLATVVRKDPGGHHFFCDSKPSKEIFVVSDGEPNAHSEPGLALDQAIALCGLEVVGSKGWVRVDLHVFQGVADTTHGLALFEELWSRYTDLVTTGDTKVEIEPIPASFEELLAARGIRKGERTGLEWLAPPADAAPAPPPAPMAAHTMTTSTARLRLDQEATGELARLARSHGTTLDALASAAALAAAATFHPAAGTDEPVAMPHVYVVDPRPWLTPPAGRTEATYVVSLASYLGLFTPDTSLLDVARGMSDRLEAEVADGLPQQLMLHESVTTPPVHAAPPSDVVVVYGGSWGIVPDLRTPADLVPVDFAGAFRPHAVTHAGVPMLWLSTFRGQLSLQATFTASRPGLPTAQQLLDATHARIQTLLGEAKARRIE